MCFFSYFTVRCLTKNVGFIPTCDPWVFGIAMPNILVNEISETLAMAKKNARISTANWPITNIKMLNV